MATEATIRTKAIGKTETSTTEATGMQKMAAKMWVPFLMMGVMIVAVAFILGVVNSATVADYFTSDKVTREAAASGSSITAQKAFTESIKAWLPPFKFLGMGMLLGGITFIVATILGALRVGGGRVQLALGVDPKVLKPPMTARMFPMLMMGIMILMAALGVGIWIAGVAHGYWNHSIANELGNL